MLQEIRKNCMIQRVDAGDATGESVSCYFNFNGLVSLKQRDHTDPGEEYEHLADRSFYVS